MIAIGSMSRATDAQPSQSPLSGDAGGARPTRVSNGESPVGSEPYLTQRMKGRIRGFDAFCSGAHAARMALETVESAPAKP